MTNPDPQSEIRNLQAASDAPARPPLTRDDVQRALRVRGFYGAGEGPFHEVRDDSRAVQPGDIFVAVPGTKADGAAFIGDAVARGARLVVLADAERRPAQPGVLAAVVDDARRALARLAALREGFPARGMQLVGVTGTNGKTSTTVLIREVWRSIGLSCGLFGTLGNFVNGEALGGDHTTPGALALHGLLRRVRDAGGRHAVMEVSSHALDQQRVAELPFKAAVFTNLTQDHLDYHRSLDAYLAAKATLFAMLPRHATAVLNAEDEASGYLEVRTAARVLTYGLRADADVRAEHPCYALDGTRFDLATPWGRRELELPLVGKYNVLNALAAAAALGALGCDLDDLARGLEQCRGVPGRMEPIPNRRGIGLYVDYAHTPDAIANVLRHVKPFVTGRMIVVFGCGGNRDRGKRPLMAAAAESWADRLIVTSDNPRFEPPEGIVAEIIKGFRPATPYEIEIDRRRAINRAVRAARPGDVVLLLGKGHEGYQQIGPERLPFDDRQVAREVCERLEAEAG